MAGLSLRFYSASDLYLHEWDERYHALVAKNLTRHPLMPTLYETAPLPYDFRVWGENHIWLHKPPLTLWVMGASIFAFGSTEIAVRLPSVLLSSLCILGIYGVGLMLTNRRSAFLAAVLYAASGPILDLAGGRVPLDHIDTFLLAFVILGVWLAGLQVKSGTRALLLPLGVVTGLAILIKSFPALIIPGVWVVWSLSERKPVTRLIVEGVIVLFVAFLVSSPWFIYARHRWPLEATWESNYNFRHFSEALEGHSENWFFYVAQLGRKFTEFVYVALIYFGVSVFRHPTSKGLVLATWFLAPHIVFSFVATKMPAYVTVSWPAIFIIYASFWWCLFDAARERSNSSRWRQVGLWMLLLIGIMLPAWLSLKRLKVHKSDQTRNPVWAQQLRTLDERISNDRPAVVFNIEHPIEAMFYNDVTAYSFIPSASDVLELQSRGFHVVVIDTGQLPRYIVNNSRIQRIAEQDKSSVHAGSRR